MAPSELDFSRDLAAFIDRSPTPYHAVASVQELLGAAGFTPLARQDPWPEGPGRFVVADGGTLIAWVRDAGQAPSAGFRIVGAHSDSPNLRVKPQPDTVSAGLAQLGVEVYGGALLNSWLDRDLGLAGRVAVRDGAGSRTVLVRDDRPLLRVPQLAIHLDRGVNENGLVLDKQRHLAPLWGFAGPGGPSLPAHLATLADAAIDDVLGWDVMAHDLTPSALLGPAHDFLSAPRLDNQLSCFAATHALLDVCDQPPDDLVPVLAVFDHEEVGSTSSTGAGSLLLAAVLRRDVERRGGTEDDWPRALAASLVVSADGAHATHPNYVDRHEPNHRISLDGGPVLKINHSMRYATEAATAAVIRQAAEIAEVDLQVFVTRSDLACGSTIGPITAAELGVATVDVGVAQLAMHSARELSGSRDPLRFRRLLAAVYGGAGR